MNHQQKYAAKMTAFEAMGLAAMLPGMQHMITLMQRELDNMRAALARVQARQAGHEEAPTHAEKSRRQAVVGYWAKMSPEERSAEMRRRGMVRTGKKGAKGKKQKHAQYGQLTTTGQPVKMHPRDPRHPGHDAWLAKLRVVQKKAWAKRRAA